MKDMYGVDPTTLSDEGKEPLSENGFTEIIPTGFFKLEHTIDNVNLNEDGTYTVYSTAKGYDCENEVVFEAISRFVPCKDSNLGYILASCELLLPNSDNFTI